MAESKSTDGDRIRPASAEIAAMAAGAERGDDDLRPDERAELEQLRMEVAGLRRQQAATARRRQVGWRTPVATLLIFLGCVLAPLSVLGVWTANQVSSTDRYVANVQPLISEPSVQHAVTDRLSTAITSRLDVHALVSQAAARWTGP